MSDDDPRPNLREAVCCQTCFYFHGAHANRRTGGLSFDGLACAITHPPQFLGPTMTCDAHEPEPKEKSNE